MRRRIFFPEALFFLTCLWHLILYGMVSSIPGESEMHYLERTKWWREGRFGIFIHWGPVSLVGTEIGWSRGSSVPVEVYDNLYKKFNPTKFNPQIWAKLFKQAGAKYVVIVTKHMDGFSMFPSEFTDYDSASTPSGRDFIGELVKAIRDEGLRVMFYYCLSDWYHPHYLPRPYYIQDPPGHQRNFNIYQEFVKNQIKELCERYHPDGIWFDNAGDLLPLEEWRPNELFQIIHSINPEAIINNRAILPGDYDTPEQTVGEFNPYRAWESCITLGTQWSWKPNDRIKSLKKCIQLLVNCAGGDGNLLLNVGPTPEGEIEERQANRLREIGQWLSRYGESIYGTRGGPFIPGKWGASTYRGNIVYLHIFNWDDEKLEFPNIDGKVLKYSLLTGGKAKISQTKDKLVVSVPKKYQSDLATIVKLVLDRPVSEIAPRPGPELPEIAIRASNVYQNMSAFGADKAMDGDETTRWATDFGIHSAWLEIDLGKPRRINGVRIKEVSEFGERVRRFAIEYKKDDKSEWKPILMGTTIGDDYLRKFIPITARYWRLNILEATEGPTIWEFELLSPNY
ncbi:alpha-L-fucosidase [bacterium]|nr:alpha-L-fucosidase [bacterium]